MKLKDSIIDLLEDCFCRIGFSHLRPNLLRCRCELPEAIENPKDKAVLFLTIHVEIPGLENIDVLRRNDFMDRYLNPGTSESDRALQKERLKDMASGNYRLWREYSHDFRGEISFGRFGI